MKTDYITPETAANQNPTRKNTERLREPKIPTPNPVPSEGPNYDKGAPEKSTDHLDIDPSGNIRNQAGGGDKSEQSGNDNDTQHEQETGPATPPEKTRDTPKAK